VSPFETLISTIDPARQVVIQAHDFPDHDAVGAAYALSRLLQARGINAVLSYGGAIQSDSLAEEIEALQIPITAAAHAGIADDAQVIVVDGFVGNSNIAGLPGEVVGVIDHHVPPEPPGTAFHDIREDMGSCCTIVYQYVKESSNGSGGADAATTPAGRLDRVTATALLVGLMMDTGFMTRGVSQFDIEAFSDLFFTGDWQMASRLLKNSLSLRDLGLFREAINSCVVAGDFCFVPLTKECTQEVMALVADFFLGLREVHFVVVVEPDREEYRMSVRSEDPGRPADAIIKRALDGIGTGGGHIHMGGGSIPRDLYPGEEGLRKRFIDAGARKKPTRKS
jgi:nanoRNase/pAp phosphatase (c-di-AMP/oligoRNAs hydrolase)